MYLHESFASLTQLTAFSTSKLHLPIWGYQHILGLPLLEVLSIGIEVCNLTLIGSSPRVSPSITSLTLNGGASRVSF